MRKKKRFHFTSIQINQIFVSFYNKSLEISFSESTIEMYFYLTLLLIGFLHTRKSIFEMSSLEKSFNFMCNE